MTANFTLSITEDEMNAPISAAAIIFPIFAFPAWILCLPPMIWHFQQSNVAAGSLILWMILHNFFNSVNSLIWPRDNVLEWWDGAVWCDVHVHIQIGSYVGLTASMAMVMRKLAIVMDTNNMTLSSSRNSKIKAKIWEVVWCWIIPLFFMAIYYVVQPVRYMIYGIVGCMSAHDSSWPSVVLGFMWPTVGMVFASYWSSLLVYRLCRYRREFRRLVAARNITSSRFIRLFILSLTVVLAYLTYSIYLLIGISHLIKGPYSWSEIHNPVRWYTILKYPVKGHVSLEKWVQIATGYVTFTLLGTGVDANAHYRRFLVRIGAGRLWPSLHAGSKNSSRGPNSFMASRSWTADLSSKAKSIFWSSRSGSTSAGSTKDVFTDSSCNNSVGLDSIPALHNVTTQDTLLSQKQNPSTPTTPPPSSRPSFFKRWFARPSLHGPLLPLFSYRNITEINTTTTNTTTDTNQPTTSSTPTGVHARAWATEPSFPPSTTAILGDGHAYGNCVHVVREVHQQRDEKGECEFEQGGKEMKAWA